MSNPHDDDDDAGRDRANRLLDAIGSVISATEARQDEILVALATAIGCEIGSSCCCEKAVKRDLKAVAKLAREAAFDTLADALSNEAHPELDASPPPSKAGMH